MLLKLKKFIYLSLLLHFGFANWVSFLQNYYNNKLIPTSPLNSIDICKYTDANNIGVLLTACNVAFRHLNEKPDLIKDQNSFLYVNYPAFTSQHIPCDENLIVFYISGVSYRWGQIMIPCFGSHNAVQTNPELDTFIDMFYLSYGFEKNQAVIYRKTKMSSPEDDFYSPQSNISLSWSSLIPVMHRPIIISVVPNTFEFSYVENEFDVQLLFIRQMHALMYTQINYIYKNQISANTIFQLCTTIIESTILRDKLVNPTEKYVMEPSVETIITELNYYRSVELIVYTIPGYSDLDYRISTPRSGTLLFYERYYIENLGLFAYKPILLAHNISILY